MREASLTEEEVATALNQFEHVVPQLIRESATVEELRRNEGYSIGYYNALVTLKGYILRTEALKRLAERDLTVERSQRGRASKVDVAAANARFQEARRRFCDFVKTALYSD